VLHQAALGSVPRSVEDPITTNASNVTGFLNMLVAARNAKVKRFVYAASSSTYGDHPGLPKVEDQIGKPVKPLRSHQICERALCKYIRKNLRLGKCGTALFQCFWPSPRPKWRLRSSYPKWIASMIKGEEIYINGDGETSRDFCYIANVVQANLLAACEQNKQAVNQVYNIAVGDRTTLTQLYEQLNFNLLSAYPHLKVVQPVYRDFRAGDVRHSLADISKATALLGYKPTHRIGEGLKVAMPWYVRHLTSEPTDN
jgi:UDP-N-acetylglucosamine/UDP-N-acetylgalactosamine 4-epimerase